jgi:hypothetical protein
MILKKKAKLQGQGMMVSAPELEEKELSDGGAGGKCWFWESPLVREPLHIAGDTYNIFHIYFGYKCGFLRSG